MKRLTEILRMFISISIEVGLFTYAVFQGGFVSWFIFYSSLPLFLYSMFIFLYPLQKISIERTISIDRQTAGETINVRMTIRKNKMHPIAFLLIEDIYLYNQQLKSKKTIAYPFFKPIITYEYEIENAQRGEYLFQDIRLMTSDLLGIVKKNCIHSVTNRLLVYPHIIDLPKNVNELLSKGNVPSYQKSQLELRNIRKYEVGDRLSHIDWKTMARTGEVMSKEFEIEKAPKIGILLDAEEDSFLEERIIFTASLAESLLKHGTETGLDILNSNHIRLPTTKGMNQFQKIYEELAKVKGHSNKRNIDLFLTNDAIYVTSSNDYLEKMNDQHNLMSIFVINENKEKHLSVASIPIMYIHPSEIRQVIWK